MLDAFVSLESQGLPLSVLEDGNILRYRDGSRGAGTHREVTVRIQRAVADGENVIDVAVLQNNVVGYHTVSVRGTLQARGDQLFVPANLANALRKGLQKNKKR